MKKLFSMLMVATVMGATALSTGFIATPCALANDIVSMNKAIPTNKIVSASLSKDYTAKPLWLNVWGAYPDNGTVTVFWIYDDALGTAHTNTTAAIQLTSGAVSTNLTALFSQYVFKRIVVYTSFSTATNGAFQLVGELYK
jgi:hypothetical protein